MKTKIFHNEFSLKKSKNNFQKNYKENFRNANIRNSINYLFYLALYIWLK